jgi:hypothetical protein
MAPCEPGRKKQDLTPRPIFTVSEPTQHLQQGNDNEKAAPYPIGDLKDHGWNASVPEPTNEIGRPCPHFPASHNTDQADATGN